MAAKTDPTETARPRHALLGRRAALIALVAGACVAIVVAALVTTGSVVASGPGNLVPGFGHGGEQLAEPDEDAVAAGLQAATAELHAHLNWLIWGPSRASLSPSFAVLADRTVVVARDEGEDEIATLVTMARDLVIHDQDRRGAHDRLEEAERLARDGASTGERYAPDPDPDTAEP